MSPLPGRALSEMVRIGMIQTSLNYREAWKKSAKMEKLEEEKAISEIRRVAQPVLQRG